ncbi:hypothetical protein [Microbacterium sp. SORGH_AS_0888]|uniref:hypothetical protein n=1 Tax=Microbacterium sp. SORGH_AS_0888 TaxID=3041791 RepID=UPI0027D7D900|nr:hypothetical protein [Microbacterium sp. SORGH_AS_0888]
MGTWSIMKSHTPSFTRRRLVGLAAVVLACIAAAPALSPSAASAATAQRATEATIDSLEFTQQNVTSGSAAELSGTWSLPDDPATPAGFTIALPEALQGRSDGFPLLDPSGTAMGQCTVTNTALDCVFDDGYLTAHPRDLHGSFTFWVTVTTETTQSTTERYSVAGRTVTITVDPAPTPGPGPGACTTDCAFTGRENGKWGSYDAANGVTDWVVQIGSGRDGLPDGDTVTVTDRPGPNQELLNEYNGTTYAQLWESSRLVVDGGREFPSYWAPADPSTYTSTASSVTFTARAGHYYDVHFMTRVTDQGVSGTYTNSADIAVEGSDTVPVTGTVVRQGGGGNGSGTTAPPIPTPIPTPTPTPTSTPMPSVGMPARTGATLAATGSSMGVVALLLPFGLLALTTGALLTTRRLKDRGSR